MATTDDGNTLLALAALAVVVLLAIDALCEDQVDDRHEVRDEQARVIAGRVDAVLAAGARDGTG